VAPEVVVVEVTIRTVSAPFSAAMLRRRRCAFSSAAPFIAISRRRSAVSFLRAKGAAFARKLLAHLAEQTFGFFFR
jgi:hypothetical protein